MTLLGLALAAGPAIAQEDSTKDRGSKEETKQDAKAGSQPADAPKKAPAKPNERPKELLDPRDFPEGLTVLAPRGDAAEGAQSFPEGVTVLGPGRPAPDGPRIRVRVEPGAPSPDLPDLDELPPPEDPARGTSLGPTGTQEGGTIGPNVGEQQEAFREPPRAGGNLLPPYVGWTPEDAYPDRDIANPYPWNPSSWIEPVFENTWQPRSTWPEGQDQRNWSPVSWIQPSIDYSWQPEDAWGRSLGIAGPRENQLSAPADAAEPGDAAEPADAAEPGDATAPADDGQADDAGSADTQ